MKWDVYQCIFVAKFGRPFHQLVIFLFEFPLFTISDSNTEYSTIKREWRFLSQFDFSGSNFRSSFQVFSGWHLLKGRRLGWNLGNVELVSNIGNNFIVLQSCQEILDVNLNIKAVFKKRCCSLVKKFDGTNISEKYLYYALNFFSKISLCWLITYGFSLRKINQLLDVVVIKLLAFHSKPYDGTSIETLLSNIGNECYNISQNYK